MENQEYEIINVTMTLKLKPGVFKYFKQVIEQGMEFEDHEGILYLDHEIESDEDE